MPRISSSRTGLDFANCRTPPSTFGRLPVSRDTSGLETAFSDTRAVPRSSLSTPALSANNRILLAEDEGPLLGILSYVLQMASYVLLRLRLPDIERPYRSPFGIPGAVVTIVIAVVTLLYQIQDTNFTKGVVWVIVWFVVAIIYFALVGRNKLILSPEEEFAMEHKAKR